MVLSLSEAARGRGLPGSWPCFFSPPGHGGFVLAAWIIESLAVESELQLPGLTTSLRHGSQSCLLRTEISYNRNSLFLITEHKYERILI